MDKKNDFVGMGEFRKKMSYVQFYGTSETTFINYTSWTICIVM